MTKEQARFNTVEKALIVIACIVIVVAGWKIYESRKDSAAPSPMTTSDTSTQDIATTTTWLEAKTLAGGFSMKIPNGWDVTNYPTNGNTTDQLGAVNPVYDKDRIATLTTVDSQPTGTQRFSVVLVKHDKTTTVTPNKSDATVTNKTVTRGGLSGKLTKTEWHTTTNGVQPGQVTYLYVFALPGDKTLRASYTYYDGVPNDSAQFDQAVQTIKIN